MKRIVLPVLVATIAVFLVACGGPREVLSAREFTSRMEGAGHIVSDDLSYRLGGFNLETALIADTGGFQVEFFVFDTNQAARSMHNLLRRSLEDGRGNISSHRAVDLPNFNRLTQTTDGRFEALVRVENTIVLIATTTENRAAAQGILDLLGY